MNLRFYYSNPQIFPGASAENLCVDLERLSEFAPSKPPKSLPEVRRDCVDLGASERFCSLKTPEIAGIRGEIASIWERLSDYAPSKPPKFPGVRRDCVDLERRSDYAPSKPPELPGAAERLRRFGSV